MGENIKMKQILRRVFENKEFESSFEDESFSWNDNEILYEEYVFKYYIEVGKVLGKGSDIVASINVIITDIEKDGDNYYHNWVDAGYNENDWYIEGLRDVIYDELISMFPFSIYPTFYGYDEYDKLSYQDKNL